ncbi:MAG: hypothetical protein IJY77_03370 [Alphaproteobacteria bacterium]|nr:hypothetical protein [Alphaproteobacteria bacterium]
MIYIKKGDSATLTTEPIETANHEPVDLSAATVKMIIKRSVFDEDSDAVVAKEVSHSESNIIGFHLSAAETAAMDVGDYVLGVKIVWDNGVDAQEIACEELRITQGVFNE